MAEYIYFVASLPSVWMDKEAPLSYAEFMEKASEQLSKKDYAELAKATFSHEEGKATSRIVQDWDRFNYRLKELMTEARAKKLGLGEMSCYKARSDRDAELEKKAAQIVAMKNPLQAEEAILSLYFDFLSSHQVSSQFSLEALIIYGLKLQIKEKVKAFDKEKGEAEFNRLYSDIQKEISTRSEYGI